VAGVSAGAVVAAVLAGFLLAGRPSETLPGAISVVQAPAAAQDADSPPWPFVLPSAPVEVEERPDAFVLKAGDSRVSASARALEVSLGGMPVVAGDFIRHNPASRWEPTSVSPTCDISLAESGTGPWLDGRRSFWRGTVRGAIDRTIRFSESELLIEWSAPMTFGPGNGDPALLLGVDLENELLEEHPSRVDEERVPSKALLAPPAPRGVPVRTLAVFLPDRTINMVTQPTPRTCFTLLRSNEGPSTWRLQTGLPDGVTSTNANARTRLRILVTSIPVIRREAYAATLSNGQLGLSVGGKTVLVADCFDDRGFAASNVIPTGYYRDERDEAQGYRFATPVDRSGQESPLVKSFLFRERSIQLAWRWQAGPEAQRSFLLEADTVMGCPYAAKTADGKTHTGTLTRKTTLSGLQVLIVDLGRRRMTFKSDAPDYAFDGERCLIVETDKGDGPGLRTGRVVVEFSSADAD